ncbi:OB-fold nucleic acid binding domain-containing protein [Stackebrandtia nassauensis]|uniref:Nucleic acid binding OB-fold tRNA/helicase-type n=1 Tax=Stackebrandtia nassauensis (strain DSM 44728 / CIP 108903 / NRRL B-16338 / NBRC 102104 / LLR-40K-21) TaxID=446470 RepID=D3Q5C6_STANL|nr:OB-fold nucleic acid binding domain-containing protein [Stackebrandtia nassauensis]ADD44175.1 nucleic acid binding OB-fold tRNA/helicase-type [Stackebrandtia nassauensis DSM 44728]
MPEHNRRRWAEILRRLTASEEDLYADQVRAESAKSGCRSCDSLERGVVAKVSGRITTVTFTPVATMPVLEAELYDGTSTVVLAWLGRRRIVGIEPGRRLIAAGRVAIRDEDRRVIYNPWYEIADTGG